MIYFRIIILIVVAKLELISSVGPAAGPIGEIEIFNLRTCPVKNNLKSSPVLNINYNYNSKSLSGNISMPFNFDNSLSAKGVFDKWSGSEWKKNVMKFDGNACDYLNKFLKTVWSNFIGVLEPKVKTTCVVKKGDYTFKNFVVKEKELDIPSIVYGKLKGVMTMNKGKNVIGCVDGTADVKSP